MKTGLKLFAGAFGLLAGIVLVSAGLPIALLLQGPGHGAGVFILVIVLCMGIGLWLTMRSFCLVLKNIE